MKPGMEVGLGTGHLVLDGDPALPPKGAQPPNFQPTICLLWPNGSMDQDATWYGGRPRPGHIVSDGDAASPIRAQPPILCPRLLWLNGSPSQLLLSTCSNHESSAQCKLLKFCSLKRNGQNFNNSSRHVWYEHYFIKRMYLWYAHIILPHVTYINVHCTN